MNYETILNFTLTKISQSMIEEDPFPYLLIDEIMPEDFYNEILKQIKHFKSWDVFHIPSKKTGKSKRREICLIDEKIEPTNNAYFDFIAMAKCIENFDVEVKGTPWEIFKSVLTSDDLKDALLSKFDKYLTDRYKPNEKLFKHIQLNQDKSKFKLNPHTDTEIKLLFGIFYLAADDLHPELCTSVYKHKHDLRSWPTTPKNVKLDQNDFIKVRSITYLPNRMVMFLKNDKSWHGVDIPENDIEWNTIYYSLLGKDPE